MRCLEEGGQEVEGMKLVVQVREMDVLGEVLEVVDTWHDPGVDLAVDRILVKAREKASCDGIDCSNAWRTRERLASRRLELFGASLG